MMHKRHTILNNERGIALFAVILVLLLFTSISLMSTLITTQEARRTTIERSTLESFYVAEAGLEKAKLYLKSEGDHALSWDTDGWNKESWNDEILGQDREMNTADDGVLSFGSQVAFSGGYYQVRVYDNNDEDSNPFDDIDNKIVIRSIGVSASGGRTILELEFYKPPLLNPPGAVYLGGNASANFSGDSFVISGDDHTIDGIPNPFGTPKFGLATNGNVANISLSNNQMDNVQGVGYDPLTAPPTPSVQHVNTEVDLAALANTYSKIADNYPSPGTYTHLWGTPTNYQITYVNGDLHVSGNETGYGVLIVTGELEITGNLNWVGVIISLNKVKVTGGGNVVNLNGALMVQNMTGPGIDPQLEIEVGGNVDIRFSSAALSKLNNLSPHVGYWREVK